MGAANTYMRGRGDTIMGKVNCDSCNTTAEQKVFNTFSYYYCSTCKKEVSHKAPKKEIDLNFGTIDGVHYQWRYDEQVGWTIEESPAVWRALYTSFDPT
jgi:hypothetical protein